MAVSIPPVERQAFFERLARVLPFELERSISDRLWAHYEELRLWSPRLSLIGPGTVDQILTRHYAESLLARPLLEPAQRLVDLGSGAGFPGLILATAHSGLEAWMVEARQRKAVFLRRAAARASLSCTVLNARVGASLPVGFPDNVDVVTVRAVRVQATEWLAIEPRMATTGRILRWVGPSSTAPPEGFEVGRVVSIPETDRKIEELIRSGREERPS